MKTIEEINNLAVTAAHALLDAIRSGHGAEIPRADIDQALELTGDITQKNDR